MSSEPGSPKPSPFQHWVYWSSTTPYFSLVRISYAICSTMLVEFCFTNISFERKWKKTRTARLDRGRNLTIWRTRCVLDLNECLIKSFCKLLKIVWHSTPKCMVLVKAKHYIAQYVKKSDKMKTFLENISELVIRTLFLILRFLGQNTLIKSD